MKAVMLEVPESLLAERRRKGLDRHDEMWDGVLHMVAPPSDRHQTFGSDLFLVLGPIAKKLGLVATYESDFRGRRGPEAPRQVDRRRDAHLMGRRGP